MMKLNRYLFVFTLTAIFLLPSIAVSAPDKPSTVAELTLYKGADRQQILEEGARKEGKLTFYTTSTWAPPLVKAFQKRYPYIRVEIWRASSSMLVPRIIEEYKVGKHIFDVVESTTEAQMVFQEMGITQPFYSPNLAYLEEGATVKAPGQGVLAAAFRASGLGLGYNTKLIAREQLPKTYHDLLDTKWKGKLPISGTAPGPWFMGTVLVNYGEDLVRQLAKQEFQVHMISPRGIIDMIIAGEYIFSPTIYDSHVINSKRKGAPVDWVPLEPVHVNIGLIALPKNVSHPHAALLFIDFELSKEGAELRLAGGYSPTRKDVAPPMKAYKKFFGAKSTDETKKWHELFNRLFMKK
ncbi:extracellular solute-binding protein [Thermodesulfobacteriota bacterium]